MNTRGSVLLESHLRLNDRLIGHVVGIAQGVEPFPKRTTKLAYALPQDAAPSPDYGFIVGAVLGTFTHFGRINV